MKFLLIALTIFTLLATNVSAQKLKKKSETSGNIKEVFYIDKESKMMLGDYFKINTYTKDTIVFGHFKNAMRIGTWVFKDYKTNEKQIEYNFTNNTLLFLATKFYPDSFLVKVDNEFIYTRVDRPLIFIGYKNEETHILGNKIEIPKSLMSGGQAGTSILRFIVDELGDISGSAVVSRFNDKIEQQVNSIIDSYSGRFLPAILNGKTVPSMFYVKLNVLAGLNFNMQLPNEFPYIIDINVFIQPNTRVERKIGYSIQTIPGSNIKNR